MRVSAVDAVALGRASAGKSYSVSHMAADGFMARVLCRNDYRRQGTLFYYLAMAVDNTFGRSAVQYGLAEFVLIFYRQY